MAEKIEKSSEKLSLLKNYVTDCIIQQFVWKVFWLG